MTSGRDAARRAALLDPADAKGLLRTAWPLRARSDVEHCSKVARRLIVLGAPVDMVRTLSVQVRNLLNFLIGRSGRYQHSNSWQITAPDGRSIKLPVGDPAAQAFKDLVDGYDGFYERALVEFVTARLVPGDTFIDIGAHLGYASCFAATTGAAVFSLEIQRDLVPLIEEAAVVNGFDLMRVLHIGAAETAGLTAFPRSSISLGARLSDAQVGENAFDPQAISLDYVATVPLDAMFASGLPAPKIVKVDAEGHEVGILHGARDLIARGETIFLVEFHAHLIGEFGYQPQDLFTLFDPEHWALFQLDDDGLKPLSGMLDIVPDPHDPNPKLVFQPRAGR